MKSGRFAQCPNWLKQPPASMPGLEEPVSSTSGFKKAAQKTGKTNSREHLSGLKTPQTNVEFVEYSGSITDGVLIGLRAVNVTNGSVASILKRAQIPILSVVSLMMIRMRKSLT